MKGTAKGREHPQRQKKEKAYRYNEYRFIGLTLVPVPVGTGMLALLYRSSRYAGKTDRQPALACRENGLQTGDPVSGLGGSRCRTGAAKLVGR